jgi:hypothetical protein
LVSELRAFMFAASRRKRLLGSFRARTGARAKAGLIRNPCDSV